MAKHEIKIGDKFKCIADYVMNEGWVAYEAGKTYVSENKNCITDEKGDINHSMNSEVEFFDHFELVPDETFSVKACSVIIDEKQENYDFINPNHYKKFSYEVIDMMEAIWGKEATAVHCEMCAFKYRMRMGEKPDQPIERDLEKVNWYLNKAKELRG